MKKKNIKNLFHLWMSIATDINNTLPNVTVLACPSCHRLGVDFQFVGDFQTKIGYMAIWCPFCLHGIHISRVRIPEKVQSIPFNTSAEEISRRIPNFTHVEPDD